MAQQPTAGNSRVTITRLPPPAQAAGPSVRRTLADAAALDVKSERIPAGNPPLGDAPSAAGSGPGLQIGLVDAIETGLRQNPDLITLRRNEGVSIGMFGVAATYPFNPYVQAQVTPLQTNNGNGSTVYHYVLVMQQIQIAHQQHYREEVAGAALQSVRWTIVQAEIVNISTTERLFFTALYQRGLRDLAQATAAMNDELLRVSQKQFEAGQISAANLTIVQLDNRATRKQLRLMEANYQTALLDLRRQLNIPLETPIDVTGDLDDWSSASACTANLLHVKCPQTGSGWSDPRGH